MPPHITSSDKLFASLNIVGPKDVECREIGVEICSTIGDRVLGVPLRSE
jgi:hypothetical protein